MMRRSLKALEDWLHKELHKKVIEGIPPIWHPKARWHAVCEQNEILKALILCQEFRKDKNWGQIYDE